MACADEKASALFVAEQYCNILDNKRELFPYYVSNQIELKWFGRTIKGKKDVCEFVAREMVQTTHVLTSVEPLGKLFCLKDSCSSAAGPTKSLSADVAFSDTDYHMTQERNIAQMKSLAFSDENTTHLPPTEGRHPQDVMMMGDTVLNMCCAPVATKVEEGQGDCVPRSFMNNSRYFQACGALHFCRTKQSPTSSKNLKLVSDTMKWEKVCKVQVGYNMPSGGSSLNEFEICLIIYEDTIRCRRNLSLEFAKVADEPF